MQTTVFTPPGFDAISMDTAVTAGGVLVVLGMVVSFTPIGALVGVSLIVVGLGIIITTVVLGSLRTTKRLFINSRIGRTLSFQEPPDVLYEGLERERLQPDSFVYFDLTVPQSDSGDAELSLDLKTFGEGSVNVLFATQTQRELFTRAPSIQTIEEFTEYGVSEWTTTGEVGPSDWSIILDNTSGELDLADTTPIDVILEYEVRR